MSEFAADAAGFVPAGLQFPREMSDEQRSRDVSLALLLWLWFDVTSLLGNWLPR
jgi:hypothetical protein